MFSIVLYYTILDYTVFDYTKPFCTPLSYTNMYSALFRDRMATPPYLSPVFKVEGVATPINLPPSLTYHKM